MKPFKKQALKSGLSVVLIWVSVTMFSCNKRAEQVDRSAAATNHFSKQNGAVALPTSPFVTGYVEVNTDDMSNVVCYTYSSGKQLFSVANIFAANINNDGSGTTGAATLYYNTQVQSVLNSGQIATLHNKGIKVLLDILGNHQNAGWSCFTSYTQADNFAVKVAAAVTQYNLDGIDIDDEYSACSGTTSTSLVWAITALRVRLGTTKLITSTSYSATSGSYSVSYNGSKPGDILDYLVEDSYFSADYASRMAPYLADGMPKSKLVIGYHMGDSDAAALASYAKTNGYAGVMAYGITNGSGSQLSQLSTITNTLYGSSSSLTSACLNPITNITPGFTYVIGSKLNTSYVLDITNGATAPGTYVQLYQSNGTVAQQWVMNSLGAGYYSLRAGNTTGLVLDVYGGATADGTRVDIYTNNSQSNQKWQLKNISDSTFTLSPASAPSSVLDDYYSGIANGNTIDIYTSNGTNAQKWVFKGTGH